MFEHFKGLLWKTYMNDADLLSPRGNGIIITFSERLKASKLLAPDEGQTPASFLFLLSSQQWSGNCGSVKTSAVDEGQLWFCSLHLNRVLPKPNTKENLFIVCCASRGFCWLYCYVKNIWQAVCVFIWSPWYQPTTLRLHCTRCTFGCCNSIILWTSSTSNTFWITSRPFVELVSHFATLITQNSKPVVFVTHHTFKPLAQIFTLNHIINFF